MIYGMNKKDLIKYLLEIGLVIVICSVGIRLLTNGETLSDYARNNPSTAYSTDNIATEDSHDESNKSGSTTTNNTTTNESALTSDYLSEDTESIDVNEESINDVDSEQMIITKENSFIATEITQDIKDKITGISYPSDDSSIKISYDDLRYLTIKYYDFNGTIQDGEIICNKAIAEDLIDIFYELFINEYQIEKVRLIDEYNGDDDLSMADNNTSCFNYRTIANSTTLSNHALGMAIDINPFYNPYIVFGGNSDGSDYIVPAGSETFCDRSLDFNHKIDKDDLCYKLFIEHGFSWGGNWNKSKDYQHFEKSYE